MQGILNDTHAHVCVSEVNQPRETYKYLHARIVSYPIFNAMRRRGRTRKCSKPVANDRSIRWARSVPDTHFLQGVFRLDQLSQVEVATAAFLHLSVFFPCLPCRLEQLDLNTILPFSHRQRMCIPIHRYAPTNALCYANCG